MNTRVQCGVTAGVAIVGASVLAVAPLTLPMPPQASPVTVEVELTATPLEQAAVLVEGLAESGIRAGTGAALAPISPVLAGTALAYGDNQRAYSVIRQSIDAPLWAADPAINALAAVLPAPFGGGVADNQGNQANDGALVQFRDNVLWAATNAIRTPIRDALDANDPANENYAAVVGAGLLQSGERFVTSTAGAPLGLIPIAEAIASGSKEELYVAIRQYIDGPLYVADPTIDALAVALPRPLGGTDGVHESDNGHDGQLINFRDDVLWRTTAAVRTPIANVLGVDPNLDKDDLPLNATSFTNADASARGGTKVTKGSELLTVTGNSSGSTAGSGTTAHSRPISTAVKAVNNEIKAAADRFERRVEKLKSAVEKKKATDAPE